MKLSLEHRTIIEIALRKCAKKPKVEKVISSALSKKGLKLFRTFNYHDFDQFFLLDKSSDLMPDLDRNEEFLKYEGSWGLCDYSYICSCSGCPSPYVAINLKNYDVIIHTEVCMYTSSRRTYYFKNFTKDELKSINQKLINDADQSN